MFILYGASLFWLYIRPNKSSADAVALRAARRQTETVLRYAAPLANVSDIAWLAGTIAAMTGEFGDMIDPATLHAFFFETQFGPVAALRLALLVLAVVIALVPRYGDLIFQVFPVVGGLLLLSQAWLGHAAEGGTGLHGILMISIYGLHMLAAGAWVGGLPPLLFCIAACRKDHMSAARDVLWRYSIMAIVAVILIVLSGVVSAGFRVGYDVSRLLATAYGAVLFVKVCLVALMLVLAFINRFVLIPRLDHPGLRDPHALPRLYPSLIVETVLGVMVLGMAAILGITPPPQ